MGLCEFVLLSAKVNSLQVFPIEIKLVPCVQLTFGTAQRFSCCLSVDTSGSRTVLRVRHLLHAGSSALAEHALGSHMPATHLTAFDRCRVGDQAVLVGSQIVRTLKGPL